ncbi:MAG: maleylpyruvate isomerase family mycothiol-dependent enzyme [Nocardiopsaceae bacterium]|nr:maleylpyruvate isomerase family mycothiol-dependent enzyme [Nocardiopsaceae bacterium]
MADGFSHDDYIDAVAGEIDKMAWIADGADPAAPVPSCPGWTMAKLITHTGTVHRWVTEIVATRATDPVSPRSLDLGLPEKESDYAGWIAEGAPDLMDALRAAGPDTQVWTWGPGGTSGWWARRMLHETTVHRADAELASGGTPRVDAAVAADGIDEFLANLPSARAPREHLAELPAGQSLHLHATDADAGSGGGEWLIRFTGTGIEVERGHAKATAAVRGPVAPLLLFAYGRIPADDERLEVLGDESLPATWQRKAAL